MLGGLGRPGQSGPVYQEELCDRFIEGIGNRDFKNYLKLEMRKMKVPTLDSLVQLATIYESVVGSPDRVRRPSQDEGYDSDRGRSDYAPRNEYGIQNYGYSRVNYSDRTGYPYRNNGYRQPQYDNFGSNNKPEQKSQIICHNCNGIGHIASRCPLNFQRSR